jgi:hypothetical protein
MTAQEHALMAQFYQETGLGALQHWWAFQEWQEQRKKQ